MLKRLQRFMDVFSLCMVPRARSNIGFDTVFFFQLTEPYA